MQKIAFVTDSTAYFTAEDKAQYSVEMVPLNVMFKGKVYRDGVDLTPEQAYKFLAEDPKDWATSAPSPGDFLAVYKKLIGQGIKEIICLSLLRSASATWNASRIAKEIILKEMPEIKIEAIDSGTALVGETLLVKRLFLAAEQGKTFEELGRLTEDYKKRIRAFLVLETIKYIYRSGRIPELAAKIAGLLPLKPILSFHGNKVGFAGASISKEKSKEKIINVLKKELDPAFPEVGLMYIDHPEETEELKNKILHDLPQVKVFIREFSPIMGYATGPGTIAIGYFAK